MLYIWFENRRKNEISIKENLIFLNRYLLGLLGIFNQCADEAVDYLSQFGDGKIEVKMADVCGRVTLDTIGKVSVYIYLGVYGHKIRHKLYTPDSQEVEKVGLM